MALHSPLGSSFPAFIFSCTRKTASEEHSSEAAFLWSILLFPRQCLGGDERTRRRKDFVKCRARCQCDGFSIFGTSPLVAVAVSRK